MSVRVEKSGFVTTVINDRPSARNAVDPQTADALTEAFLAFDADEHARVAVFWGAGGAFCSGWDLKYAARFVDQRLFEREIKQQLAFPDGGAPVPRGVMGPTRLELRKPVIAAIEGPAVAGGLELAIWCDLRVASEDAYFGFFSRRWGVPIIDGGSFRLPALVGRGRALDIIMTGRKIPADEALRIGLCDRVVPRGGSREAAEEIARQMSRFPQTALRVDRANVYDVQGLSVGEALRREWSNAVDAHGLEGAAGAARFASGKGRHGGFSDID